MAPFFRLPAHPVPAMFAAILPIIWLALRPWRWQPFAGRMGICPRCGYDRSGNMSGTCPECGRKIKAGSNVR
ncbi:MAG: hypothetical protein JWP03_3943 [Phycisphaerales bacterium]|nr:hypothetical protein [Phycisphaerales bacterium]